MPICRAGRSWHRLLGLTHLPISTHASGRGRSVQDLHDLAAIQISTHAPAQGCDPTTTGRPSTPTGNFYSRPRAGAIIMNEWFRDQNLQISTHAPGRGRSQNDLNGLSKPDVFLLTPPGGGDRRKRCGPQEHHRISTHAPGRGRSGIYAKQGFAHIISTHAPGRGRSAIFHKTDIMFRGKLPKDHLLFYGIRLA